MLQITKRVSSVDAMVGATLSLPYDQRQKSRLLVMLDDGQQAGVLLPRGTSLKQGDILEADNGLLIGVRAVAEDVTTANCNSNEVFAKACYHLGNRHVPLQIGQGWLRYTRDHVLDDMVRLLGLVVKHELAPFEPELGAYHAHGV